MRRKSLPMALIPGLVVPAFLSVALQAGCGGDDGTLKPMVLSEENKANIEAERKADEEARARKPAPGQP